MKRQAAERIGAALFWILLWQALAMLIHLPLLLPSPTEVAGRWIELVQTAAFWQSLLVTLSRIALGFFAAMFLGILLAMLSAKSYGLEVLLAPLMTTVRSVPVASFAILAIIWFSKENLSALISFTMAMPILYTNTLAGIRALDPQLSEMAALFRIPHGRRIRCVELPQIMPFLRSGITIASGLCWKSGVAAELIGQPRDTIGQQLYNAKIYLETPDVFAWTLTVILLSLAFQFAVLKLTDAVVRRAGRV